MKNVRLLKTVLCVCGLYVFGMESTDAADAFTWIGESADWDAAGVWEPAVDNASDRTAPGFLGDSATIGGKSVVTLSTDKTLSALTLMSAYSDQSAGAYTLDGAGCVLTLAGSEGASGALTNDGVNANYQRSSIGNWGVGTTMKLNLADPLDIAVVSREFPRISHLIIGAQITGGTEEKPSPIRFSVVKTGFLFLTNPANDFRGDFVFDESSTTTANLILGLGGRIKGANSMLGHPANEIYFKGKDPRLMLNECDAAGLRRTVHGSGSIQGQRYENQWFISTKVPVVLGEGCVLDPSNGNSPYGSISVIGTSVSIDPMVTYRMSVGVEGCDKVALAPTSSFIFRGRIEIVEESEVAEGTQFALFTIDKTAGSVTFEPDYIPENYTVTCDGNAADGWVVTATKRRSGADVSALQVSLIADTYATFNCDVTQVVAEPITVRAYYGTTDGGADPVAWESSKVIAENVTEMGTLSARIDNLTQDTTYFVRFAVETSDMVQMSVNVVTFTTRDYFTPDTFTWNFSGSAWSDAEAWTIAGPYARHQPGTAGDIVVFPEYTDHTVLIDDDYAVGAMLLRKGRNRMVKLTSEEPHVLTLDNLGEQALLESAGEIYHWYFGTSLEDGLSLRLASPLKIARTAAYNYDFWLYSRMSGGSMENPVPIYLSCTSDQWGRLYVHLFNPDNDFIGDWYIGEDRGGESKTNLYLGDKNNPSIDSMLGDPRNRVMLRRRSTLTYFAGAETAASCRRSISGDGEISSQGDFLLTGEARLEPCGMTGTGFGTIKITSTGNLSDDAATLYSIDVSVGDAMADAIEMNAVGELSINGTFVIIPDDPSVKIESGTRWTVGHLTGSGIVGRKRFAASQGYRVWAEGDAENGWTVYAEKSAPGFNIIIR